MKMGDEGGITMPIARGHGLALPPHEPPAAVSGPTL